MIFFVAAAPVRAVTLADDYCNFDESIALFFGEGQRLCVTSLCQSIQDGFYWCLT